ncbi:hypothetical protein JOJ88_004919 [Pantoea cypripedii]|nr:hypothetical protein [Pantoea cypripedii]
MQWFLQVIAGNVKGVARDVRMVKLITQRIISFFECFQQNPQLLLSASQVYSFSHRGKTPHNLKIISEELTMKSIKTFVAVAALSLVSFGSFAQSITASASTLDGAEAKIAAQAKQAGASYKITGARVDNGAYLSAELTK